MASTVGLMETRFIG